ncbi:MAG TPA: ATP-binding protein [Acidimicrobiales bacterium]|nr:ATP-binding protein [Acidimicrobiales bacterium]
MRRTVLGSAVGIGLTLVVGAALVPLRSHISVATSGLVLVVPVVAGVAAGGFTAGLISVLAGFLAYDLVFIPPYYTLTVNAGQNWVALGVYVVVMVLVARVVSRLEDARALAGSREANARGLFEMSELLLADQPVPELARTIVDGVRKSFALNGVALLLSADGQLQVAASSGEPIGEKALAQLRPESHLPVPLRGDPYRGGIQTLALATSRRPVGLLALDGTLAPVVWELLPALANHFAIALERSQLRERVRHAELLEEIDRLRHALVGAVSHDLRTPLATIKVASSTLMEPTSKLSQSDVNELHSLIDTQTDRLTRIVNDVLDMTRIKAGVLEIRRQANSTLDLVAAAVSMLRPALQDRGVEVVVPASLPLVSVDHVLIEQVLSNLLDNADRHAPPGTQITVRADLYGADQIEISVTDSGPGVPPSERQAVFDTFVGFDTGGRAGLGLAIAKAFVEAHGERIWVEDAPGGGARFAFTVPVAPTNGARQ